MNSGSVSLEIQTIDQSSPMRITIAAMRPTRRARFCCSFGSLPDRIEMKMTLSTPRTISRKVRVTSGISSSCMVDG